MLRHYWILFKPLINLASTAVLHLRMVAVKADELGIARELSAEAYHPVRKGPSLEALERQHRLLGADALEKRALGIHEWSIDEATLARVITIAPSVIQ